jgi:leader peptidase (prepilin peptidase)/N-methyltransferase
MDDGYGLALAAACLVAITVWISVIDWRKLIIPDGLNALNAAAGLCFAGLLKSTALLSCVAGGVLGFVTLMAFASCYRRVRGADGVGFGDVKFMAGAGFWVGWEGIAPLLLVASVSALLFQSVRGFLGGGLDWHQRFAFGPFLSFGTLTVWIVQVMGTAPWQMPS